MITTANLSHDFMQCCLRAAAALSAVALASSASQPWQAAHTCRSMPLRLLGGLAEGLRLLVELRLAGCQPPLAERERRGDREPLLGDEGLYRAPSLNKPVFSNFSAACRSSTAFSAYLPDEDWSLTY